MHSPKMDAFVLVVAAMSDKMVEMATAQFEQEEHLARHHEQLDERARTISSLREQVEDLYAQRDRLSSQVRDLLEVARERDTYKGDYARLMEECQKLRQENYKWEYGLQGLTDTEAAKSYMNSRGERLWADAKIAVIKVIRQVTGWDLHVAKGWCEAHMGALQSAQEQKKAEEESGPHTKRSSQVPQGVPMPASLPSVEVVAIG